jgi:seryl-tRNA synthetase
MLQVAVIREHRDTILTGLKKRGLSAEGLIEEAIRLDDERKKPSSWQMT